MLDQTQSGSAARTEIRTRFSDRPTCRTGQFRLYGDGANDGFSADGTAQMENQNFALACRKPVRTNEPLAAYAAGNCNPDIVAPAGRCAGRSAPSRVHRPSSRGAHRTGRFGPPSRCAVAARPQRIRPDAARPVWKRAWARDIIAANDWNVHDGPHPLNLILDSHDPVVGLNPAMALNFFRAFDEFEAVASFTVTVSNEALQFKRAVGRDYEPSPGCGIGAVYRDFNLRANGIEVLDEDGVFGAEGDGHGVVSLTENLTVDLDGSDELVLEDHGCSFYSAPTRRLMLKVGWILNQSHHITRSELPKGVKGIVPQTNLGWLGARS